MTNAITKPPYTTARGNPCDDPPASPVLHNAVPVWLVERVVQRFGPGYDGITSGVSPWSHHSDKQCPRFGRWMDHEGSILHENFAAFASELYYPVGSDFSEIEDFVAKLGCRLEVSSESFWYPGHTSRIVVVPHEFDSIFTDPAEWRKCYTLEGDVIELTEELLNEYSNSLKKRK